ncbi:MAG: cupredoxin domain-containing protein [Candidatus Limnocylindrales bacterium]
MRSLRFAALGLLAVALVGCATTTPGWTYAPAPSLTPAPSASADASAEPSTSAAPSDSAAPSESAAAGGTVIDLAAAAIAFDQAALSAPAGAPFQIAFANNDAGTPHNVEIKDGGGASVYTGEVFSGVATKTYDIPALAAGTYSFVCTVHPNMVGTLTAG